MPQKYFRSSENPVNTDDVILQYFLKNPDAPLKPAARLFHSNFARTVKLRQKAKKLLAAQSPVGGKKVGKTDWRECFSHANTTKKLRSKSSFSQDYAMIDVQAKFNIKTPIVIQMVSDLHIGAMGTNYDMITEITDGLLKTPNLFWILNGDLTETTAQFKNALAVHSQAFDIEMQHNILESWLDTVAPKIVSAGWDNHGVEREERHGAFSHIKQLLSRRFVYHNGMGRIDIKHGNAIYKMVVSHNVFGYSVFNHLNGIKRLMRLQFPDVDMGVTGDKHSPCCEIYYEGEFKRAAIMSGSTNIDCGYSKRYFSLFTQMNMPAIVLYPDEKFFSVYMNAAEALAVANGLKEVPKY